MCHDQSRILSSTPPRLLAGLFLTLVLAGGPPLRAASTDAPAPASVNAFTQNQRLGRGVNILGYDPIWRQRDRARFTAEDFRLIHEAGFQNVRINLFPFRYGHLDAQNRISPAWFRTLDWAVRNALANHLMVVLDLHEFNAMARDPLAKKERYLAVWRQIAAHYRHAPSSVLFELLNEPHGEMTPALWNQFLREALAVVRRTNPDRTVVIGPGFWNNPAHLRELKLPANDRNIIVTIHYYSPMKFTHQGAPWTSERDRVGVPWGSAADRAAVVRDFDHAQAWATQHHRPIYLGEFGAYDKAAMKYRVAYLSFVARQAEKRHWSWSYWQFDSDFILYDIPHHHWIEPILHALIPGTTATK